MALFGARSTGAGGRTIKLVEAVLEDLGLDANEAQIPSREGMLWGLVKGSAEVYVRVVESDDDNFVQVISPMMAMPDDEPGALLQRLLQLNADELSGAAFGVRGDRVVVTAERPVTGLERAELKDMIVRVGTYADHYDDMLVAEYGGKKHTEA